MSAPIFTLRVQSSAGTKRILFPDGPTRATYKQLQDEVRPLYSIACYL